MFSWKTLESNTNDKIYKQIPSECDGISILLCFFSKLELHVHLFICFSCILTFFVQCNLICLLHWIDENNCLLDACLNGKCTDLNGGYECQCEFGFTGNNCEENIDDCDDHACENNATCVDGTANYTCDCLYGFKGELCEIAMGICLTDHQNVNFMF